MKREKRIEYLLTTLSVLVMGFILYGLLGSIDPFINENKVITFLIFGCLGGFSSSMILSTIILSANFFRKKRLSFKIVAAILWPFTIACCFYAGIFGYIPYQIYNIVKIIKDKPKIDINQSMDHFE